MTSSGHSSQLLQQLKCQLETWCAFLWNIEHDNIFLKNCALWYFLLPLALLKSYFISLYTVSPGNSAGILSQSCSTCIVPCCFLFASQCLPQSLKSPSASLKFTRDTLLSSNTDLSVFSSLDNLCSASHNITVLPEKGHQPSSLTAGQSRPLHSEHRWHTGWAYLSKEQSQQM